VTQLKLTFNNPFEAEGTWLKGVLHVHTTESDGELTPEQVVHVYYKRGYQFVAITDHWKLVNPSDFSITDDFLVIPGEEITAGKGLVGTPYHIVALNIKEELERGMFLKESPEDARAAIKTILNLGGLAVIAHPSWSDLCFADLLCLEGYLGIEVFNMTCHVTVDKGWSWSQWIGLLSSGKQVFGLAVDDAHWHTSTYNRLDAFGGWVLVKAKSLRVEDVLESIKKGLFYSSTGPLIHNVEVSNNTIHVKTSPVISISFLAYESRGRRYEATHSKYLTEVSYTIKGNEKFIVIKCEDGKGGVAWTNPIIVKDS